MFLQKELPEFSAIFALYDLIRLNLSHSNSAQRFFLPFLLLSDAETECDFEMPNFCRNETQTGGC